MSDDISPLSDLTSLSMIISRSTHVVANDIYSLLLMNGQVIVHCIYIPHREGEKFKHTPQ